MTPSYNISKEVRLTLDASGKLLKKIGYSYLVDTYNSSSIRFKYDTLVCVYDAAGFLKETRRGFYDSTRAAPGITMADRATYNDTFTTVAGNLTRLDRYTVFNRIIINTSGTILSGGSAENHTTFNSTKLYPNKTDFRNAAVLNETLDFYGFQDYYGWVGYFEPLLDGQYQNMPEKAVTHSVERDLNGTVTFNYTSTYEVARTYNPDGLLSVVDLLTVGTPYTKLRYFYVR